MTLDARWSEITPYPRGLVLGTLYTLLGSSDRMWEQWPQITLEPERTHGILFYVSRFINERTGR